uniref:Hippocampus abundant transcript-like protein 1 isoform X2 n=1 Tax=Nicotiana sylvestris TaxID=4096 RepID=A0A1U7YV50_NICSY|nr:PREDICTED: hippocampus abundant transcript-like protein 1 isoform X2 [Nicotiana sylvestris]
MDSKISSLKHLFVTVFLSNFALNVVNPAMTDITMDALCPSQDKCSLAIYLSGLQQAIMGLGSMLMMPLIGNLSDVYGRKALLIVPVTASILPSDCISEEKRASAIGIVAGVGSAAYLCGTFAARFLSTAQIFLVSSISSTAAAVYMTIFLKETTRINKNDDALNQPILTNNADESGGDDSSEKTLSPKSIPSFYHIIRLLKSSTTFSLATSIAFLYGIGEGGIRTPFMYFLRARFQYNKDNFAILMLICYGGATFSQLILVPKLAPIIREETILSSALIAGFTNMLIDSIAWAAWVPYIVALFPMFLFLAKPALQSIVSKQVGPNEQGIAQGCISGVNSFANILSPFIFSPLTDLFLSERAPFNYPGFSMFCIGLAWLIAFIPSMMIRFGSYDSRLNIRDVVC